MPLHWGTLLFDTSPDTWRQVLDLDAREAAAGLPAGLATAVLRKESGGDPRALNKGSGAAGLWQLRPNTARAHGVNAYDPVPATDAALTELGTLYAKYAGDLPKTLAGYNWGQGRVDRLGLAKAPQETRDFISTILGWLSPASAEAATPAGRDWGKDLFGAPGAAAPGTRPAPPAAAGLPPSLDDPAMLAKATAAARRAETFPRTGARPEILYDLGDPSGDWLRAAGRTAAATGISVAGTAGGAALGGLTSPVTGLVGPVAGAVAGSLGARKLNVALELEEPGLLGDAVSVVAPVVPAVPALARAGKNLGVRAAGAGAQSAIDTAATQTAAQAARLVEAEAAATSANAAAQAVYRAKAATSANDARMAGQAAQQAYEAKVAVQATRLAEAEAEATVAQQAAQDAWRTKSTSAANDARMAAQAAQQRYDTELAAYSQAVQTQNAAVTTARAIPGRSAPTLPPRTWEDIRTDMKTLDRGGEAADAVMERLGTTTRKDALDVLMQEGRTTPPPAPRGGEPIVPSYRSPAISADPYKTPDGHWKVPLRQVPAEELELQDFIRQQGGIKLSGEELQGEFGALISRKQTGLTGLQNNVSGRTAQQMAEAAHERGFLPTADKQELLDAINRSVSAGHTTYSVYRTVPEPASAVPGVVVLPTRGAPTPSHVLYARLKEVAGSSPVDLTPAITVASTLKGQLGESIPSMQPSLLQRVVSDLEQMGSQGSVAQVHQALKDLSPLMRSQDGRTRGVAKQLYGALQDSMTQSAIELPETRGARTLLLQANAAARREFAVQDMEQVVRRAVTIGDDGLPRLAPGRLLTMFDRLVETDTMFRGSFSPAELAAVRADFARLAGTPKIPARQPQAPGPVLPKGIGPAPTPEIPRSLASLRTRPAPVPPGPSRPKNVGLPPEPVVPARLASLRARPPVEPEYPSPSGARILAEIGTGLGGGLLYGQPLKGAIIGGAAATADSLYAVLSRALLTPRGRAILAAAQEPGGRISPATLAALAEVVKLPARSPSTAQRPGR